jgi:L-iditol 2-dehydrogenase
LPQVQIHHYTVFSSNENLFSRLPDNMDLEEGALMEPLSVGVHACKRAGVRVGSVVLVLGAGPIGLVSMLTAKAMGASKVIITDLVDHRLKKARELGADFTLRIDKSMTEDDIIKTIKTQLGQDPTVTLECTGAEQCVRVALQVMS